MLAVLGCSQSGETPSSDPNSETVAKEIVYRRVTTPDEFPDRWNEGEYEGELIKFPAEALADINIPDDAKRFLESNGLPRSASPFLNFKAPSDGPLETAAQRWQLSADYNRYHVIGFDGSGNSICIDDATEGQVVYLDLNANSRRVFMNSSILQLAESLLAYRHLGSETQRRNGEDAFLDGNIPDDLKQWLHDELQRIDSAAVAEGCLWSDELENLSQMAE
jgi:hypothetical protein